MTIFTRAMIDPRHRLAMRALASLERMHAIIARATDGDTDSSQYCGGLTRDVPGNRVDCISSPRMSRMRKFCVRNLELELSIFRHAHMNRSCRDWNAGRNGDSVSRRIRHIPSCPESRVNAASARASSGPKNSKNGCSIRLGVPDSICRSIGLSYLRY